MPTNDKYTRSRQNNEKGGNFSVIDTSKYPDIKFIKYKEKGEYALDIVPYKIGSKHHPDVCVGKAEVGDEDYLLDIRVHRNVGPKKMSVICPRSMNHKCVICDYLDEIKNQYGWESAEYKKASKVAAQRKAFYFVVDPDAKEQKLSIFEASYKNFQSELLDQAESDGAREGLDGLLPFAEWPKGCTVEFRVTMVKNGGSPYPYPEFKSFAFKKRKGNEYPEDFLEDVPSLDSLMIVRSADEVAKLFEGYDGEDQDDDDGEAEETSTRHKRDEEEEAPRSRKRDEEEETPRSRKRDEEEPPRRTRDEEPVEQKLKCPVKGGTFGDDVDEFKECNDCDLRNKCSAEYKNNRRSRA